ncbi:MAG: hypothetical protein O7D93_11340 [Acidobacteria bacterium]|nr:hypothetical protein [Acidobacteriota bacterium]
MIRKLASFGILLAVNVLLLTFVALIVTYFLSALLASIGFLG